VLLIAWANVASLLLARSMARSREIAIRAAVGATRWRIVRQLLIECLLLAVLAATVGAVLSHYGADLLATGFDPIEPGMPNARPYWVDLSMDGSSYLFIALVCLVTTIGFGLGPALHLSRGHANAILKDGGRWSTARTQRWSGVLVTAEIAMTLVLLTTAGLMWRTFITLYHADLVIDTSRLMTMRVNLPTRDFFFRLEERLATSGRLSSVALTTGRFIGSPGSTRSLSVAGQSVDPSAKERTTQILTVGDRFFETIGLPIVRGRALTRSDGDIGAEGAVVNERFAALFFPNQDPIGQRIQLANAAMKGVTFPWHIIVGVSRTVPSPFVNQQAQPVVYVPVRSDPEPPRFAAIVVGDMSLAAAAAVLREEVRALNPSLAVHAIESLDTDVARGRMAQKLLGTWLGILAGSGLLLASIGLYALTAHGVVQRTQEIGLRIALGAPVGQVIWLFLRRSLTHLALGLTLGMAGALFAGKLFASFLVGGGSRDYATTSLVTLVLIVVATLASMLPARRAANVDPLVALRHE
jgi:putative ABC transport system permease protein